MSDIFRKSLLNRLPPMAPTAAPWAEDDEDIVEELHEEDEAMDGLGDLGIASSTG
jgi:protein phosphatase methylesterase 1